MASIMDMLADVPFEEVENNFDGEEAENKKDSNEEENEDDLPKTDLFDLADEEDENMESNHFHSFYTEPLILEKKENQSESAHTEMAHTEMAHTEMARTEMANTEMAHTEMDHTEMDRTEIPEVLVSKTRVLNRKKSKKQVVIKSKKLSKKLKEAETNDVTGKDPSQPEPAEKPYDPNNPDPNGPKYCHCRWGESGVMVECEECGEWYHDECIGLTEEETYNIETYYCAPCCSSNSDLVTKYKQDPVKLRQKIINDVRDEEKLKKPKRVNSNIKPEDRALNRKLSAAKTPKTPRARAPKPKRVSLSNENKETKRNKILNNSAKRKISSDYSSSDDDKVAFVICEECGDSFPSKMALKRHSKKHEENPDLKFQCEECGKICGTSKSLRDHEVIHSGVKPFSCMFCGEAFFLMTQLTNHTNTKHLNVRHQCESCSRSYSTKPALQSHMKKAHGEIADSD